MKRAIDIAASSAAIAVLAIPALVIAFAIRTTSPGPVLYWSNRVGRGARLFRMPKFRTMRVGTPELATDRLDGACRYITPIGAFLRNTSIDELPQLWSVLRGDMSLVGPRPALHNQYELIHLRERLGVNDIRPGVTGLAQVRGRDELSDAEKARIDAEYLKTMTLALDLKILVHTVSKVVRREGIRH
jgi:O-antigen biosynthesis protein WbqP